MPDGCQRKSTDAAKWVEKKSSQIAKAHLSCFIRVFFCFFCRVRGCVGACSWSLAPPAGQRTPSQSCVVFREQEKGKKESSRSSSQNKDKHLLSAKLRALWKTLIKTLTQMNIKNSSYRELILKRTVWNRCEWLVMNLTGLFALMGREVYRLGIT